MYLLIKTVITQVYSIVSGNSDDDSLLEGNCGNSSSALCIVFRMRTPNVACVHKNLDTHKTIRSEKDKK